MSRYRGPRLRIVRRLGELPGLTSKTSKNQARPGQHGMAPRKVSQYGIRLQEKQKIRFSYGITERQLSNYVKKASHIKGAGTAEKFYEKLESRLDNAVYRMGLCNSRRAARQWRMQIR